MRVNQMFLGALVALASLLVACSEDLGQNAVVEGYAVATYIQPSTVEVFHHNENVSLYFQGKNYWEGSKAYADYTVRYGDRKEKRYLMNAECVVVVGIEQMQVLQHLEEVGDTMDVSQYYDVVYRDNKAYVQGNGKYRLKHMPNTQEGRVALSACTKEQYMWLFSNHGTVLQSRDSVATATLKAKGTRMLVLTLQGGRKLTVAW